MVDLARRRTPAGPDGSHRNDKRRGRLNIIRHLLDHVHYEELPREKIKFPKRQKAKGYVEPKYPYKYIEERY